MTSLHHASSRGHESVVRSLVKLRADIHAEDNEYTQRHFYVFHELTIIMNLSGYTSLHYASGYNHESVVRSLVELRANIHVKDYKYPNFISTCFMN